MPTVHPQVQKARDLLPLVAAASDENDDIRELTISLKTKRPKRPAVEHDARKLDIAASARQLIFSQPAIYLVRVRTNHRKLAHPALLMHFEFFTGAQKLVF